MAFKIIAGVSLPALVLAGLVTVAGATSPQAAFYTWQAPGGASTNGQRVIALSFDDGPGPFTPQVLSVLEQYHVPATFFEIGENVAAYPQYTQMLASAGYPVENHTWSHPDLATLPPTQVDTQIDQTQNEIHSLTGATPNCLRPPYDDWNAAVLDQIAGRGLTAMSYSIDPRDWSLPGVTAIVSAVVGGAFPGAVVDMHDAGGTRSETVASLPSIINDLRGQGYTFVSICGKQEVPPPPNVSEVFAFGRAPAPGPSITSTAPFVGATVAPGSYRLTTADGAVYSNNLATFGSMRGMLLAKPIVGMAGTAGGKGYWLVASDGGIFGFGNAGYHGSMGGRFLAKPIVGMAADPKAKGYWEVASDGGVFRFDAPFYGSMGGKRLNAPIVGMAGTPDGRGYWLVGADGGIFNFGDAHFYGSAAGKPLTSPVVGMAANPKTGGYWELCADGKVFAFHAPWVGTGSGDTVDHFFAIVASRSGQGFLLAGQHPAPTS